MTKGELSLYRKHGAAALAAEADRQLAANLARSRRLAPRKAPGLEKKQASREERNARRREVREACVARAGGRCEGYHANAAGEIGRCSGSADEMDHVFGRARAESVDTCWMLCHKCHGWKTDNRPSRAAWLGAFTFHAAAHEYWSAYHRAERAHDSALAKAKAVGPTARRDGDRP